MMWARFVARQDHQSVLRGHIAAFEALGGVAEQILYDRVKTAVPGEGEAQGIAYNPTPAPGTALRLPAQGLQSL